MKVRRKKHDDVFSKLVRERANYTCENCGVNKRHEPQTLDCAHIMSRRSLALRWHPANAMALCRSCHMFFTEHPFDWSDFCREKLGEKLVDELRLVSNQTVNWTKKQREEIYQHMKSELKAMETQATENGRLEFVPHPLMHVFGKADPLCRKCHNNHEPPCV